MFDLTPGAGGRAPASTGSTGHRRRALGRDEARGVVLHSLRDLVASLDPEVLRGADAARLLEFFVELSNIADTGNALCARRRVEANAHVAAGEQHAPTWLSKATGETVRASSEMLATAHALRDLPVVEQAFRSGELSAVQVRALAGARGADADTERRLVELARVAPISGLERACAAARAATEREDDRRSALDAVHRRRSFRTFTDRSGACRGEIVCTAGDMARLLAVVESRAEELFAAARAEGRRERRDACRLDALLDVATGAARRPHRVVVRVDAAALRHGAVGAGEACEIPGVGPVPVATAREALGDAVVALVVADGVDVRTVVGLGRTVPRAVRVVLLERDPCCVVPGCGSTVALEIDHYRVAFALGGRTELANLARICRHHHHHLKTYRGYRLEGGPGDWRWLPPPSACGPGPFDEGGLTRPAPGDTATAGP
ncbi:MAG TPA: HNH endonuclease signature motif containing protein [Acidimicrobiales bacterium]|nr:HNH endonuclease signature motif containing protein [Acidimicrobiales bacterium]